MSLNVGAVEASVQAQADVENGTAAESPTGSFGARRVEVSTGKPNPPTLRESHRAGALQGSSAERSGGSPRRTASPEQRSSESGPVAGPPDGPGARAPAGMADVPPPWLNPERIAALAESDKRLQALAQRHRTVGTLGSDLRAAIEAVQLIEKGTCQAHALFEKSHSHALSDDDTRILYSLVTTHQPDLVKRSTARNVVLEQLLESGRLEPGDVQLLAELGQRFEDAHDYWRRIGLSWLGAGQRLEVALPLERSPRAAVESHVVPGSALGAHFPGGYPLLDGSRAPHGLPYPHVPDLALTGLTNAGNEILFLGVRHALIHSNDFTPEFLKGLSRRDLRSVLSGIYEAQSGSEGRELMARDIHKAFALIARYDLFTHQFARLMRTDICNYMHVETLAAALLANPENMNQALLGEPVAMPLFSIALLTPRDVENWSVQKKRFDGSKDHGQRVHLDLRVPSVRTHQVVVMTGTRQFALAAEGSLPGWAQQANRESAEGMLGPLGSPKLSGELGWYVEQLKANREALADNLAAMRAMHFHWCRNDGENLPWAISARRSMQRCEQDIESLDKRARTLEEAGAQLKTLWMRHGGWPTGRNAQAAAARLALVGYNVGATPLLSCARGRDFTATLDSHVKLLATAADCSDGKLPAVELDNAASWRHAGRVFDPA